MNFVLDQNEANLIIAALSELAVKTGAGLVIAKMQEQAKGQLPAQAGDSSSVDS